MKRNDKSIINSRLQKINFIIEAGSVPNNETLQEKNQRIENCKKDYKLFFETYFPHYATAPCADFQIQAAKKIIKNNRIKACFEWARGLGKSVHFDIGIPFWLWLNGQLKFMVLISANFEAAKSLLADIQAEFEANPLIRHDFGDLLQIGSWTDGDFSLADGTRFVARGRSQRLRGLRSKAARPDYIVIDDTDDDELSQNPDRVRKVIQWIYKAVLGLGDKGNFRVLIVNNRISNNSILAHFANHKAWIHSKVNALLNDGTPAWHQKYSAEYYKELENQMDYYSFQTEFLNNPIIAGNIFKNSDILWHDTNWRFIKSLQRIILYWDPAYTANQTSDYNAIVIVGFKDNYIYVIDAFIKQCTPEQAIDNIYSLYLEFKNNNINIECYVERQLINQIIDQAYNEIALKHNFFVPLIRDDKPKKNKELRIINMYFYFQRQFIFFNSLKKDNFSIGLQQLLAFEKGSSSHDDFPDALEAAIAIGFNSLAFANFTPRLGFIKKNNIY